MAAVAMHHFSGPSAPFVRSKGTVSGGVFTNTEPKLAMMTLDISGKPAEMDVKEYIADNYGAAILKLSRVEEQFLPALEAAASERETISGMISVEL